MEASKTSIILLGVPLVQCAHMKRLRDRMKRFIKSKPMCIKHKASSSRIPFTYYFKSM